MGSPPTNANDVRKEEDPPSKLTELLGEIETSYGEVFASEKAARQIFNRTPEYPVGSIIVREKHSIKGGSSPEKVIAMVKREPGFSLETEDWEFFMFEGGTMALTMRETAGSCAECHIRAKETDWSFRSYLASFSDK